MPFVTIAKTMGTGLTVGRSLKAAEERFLYEMEAYAEAHGHEEPPNTDPLSEFFFMRVKKGAFYGSLSEQAQVSYNQGLGVLWPFDEPLVEIVGGREKIEEYKREAEEEAEGKEPDKAPATEKQTQKPEPAGCGWGCLILLIAFLFALLVSLLDR